MPIPELENRYLIADKDIIDKLQKQFLRTEHDIRNWTSTYINHKTGEKWLYYPVDSEYQGGGNPVMGRLPLPDTAKLIDIVLNSNFEDEVFAACRTLVNNEQYKKTEFRVELIDKLEVLKNSERQKTIIRLTELDSRLNRRETIGKTTIQVEKDANFFRDIAERAMKLI